MTSHERAPTGSHNTRLHIRPAFRSAASADAGPPRVHLAVVDGSITSAVPIGGVKVPNGGQGIDEFINESNAAVQKRLPQRL